jgi:hypothetical protein
VSDSVLEWLLFVAGLLMLGVTVFSKPRTDIPPVTARAFRWSGVLLWGFFAAWGAKTVAGFFSPIQTPLIVVLVLVLAIQLWGRIRGRAV